MLENEKYWYVTGFGDVESAFFGDTISDRYCIANGNCFRTKEEAEANADRIRKEIMG